MQVMMDIELLNENAFKRLNELDIELERVSGKAWMLGIVLDDGKTVAAYPISRINPLAPPSFYITGPEDTEGVCNRCQYKTIIAHLSKYTDAGDLYMAVTVLKKCIRMLSSK